MQAILLSPSGFSNVIPKGRDMGRSGKYLATTRIRAKLCGAAHPVNRMFRPPLSRIIKRAACWRCPHCGRGVLFQGVFRMLPRCPECGLSYFPEQGYYVGAMIINYIVTTTCVVAIFLLSLLFADFTTFSTNAKILLWMGFAIALSLLLMRHSYSLWLGIDYWVKPRPPDSNGARTL
jgi:uncharacterized protein (DUF983 family)